MSQADFAYDPTNDAEPVPLAVSTFADPPWLRDELRADVPAAGLEVRECGELAMLDEGTIHPLGEVILVDCPRPQGAELAALARIDMRATRSRAHLVISTTVDALEDVFACRDQPAPQILVDASRADRIIALGRVLGDLPPLRARELDRMTLLRLTEQVSRIAERIEKFSQDPSKETAPFRFESPSRAFKGAAEDNLVRAPRPPLPAPRLVRRIIRQRQLRARSF